jgi:hypothetical protein
MSAALKLATTLSALTTTRKSFVAEGSSIGGWRYLEAAPVDLGPAMACNERLDDLDYGRFRQMIDNARGVGRGKYNTEYIMADARKRGGGFGWAAQLCDTYELGGFDDWFLPSQDELNYMYGNLFLRELGNFREDTYWSSTPAYWDNTWMDINLSNGSQTRAIGMDKKRVSPCRQF